MLPRSLSAAALAAALLASPLIAQDEAGPAVTVDQADLPLSLPHTFQGCETNSSGDEIVVCARRSPNERYRLPRQAWNPNGATASVSRERHSLYEQGDSGIGSCSTVGPGGWTGCAHKAWKAAREQHGR